MTSVLSAVDALVGILRIVFFAFAALLVVVAAIDWLVRTRRLNPFGPVARFFRQTVDPMFAPVERQLVRAGGTPTAAPWWALAGVVLGGIIILTVIGFLRTQIMAAGYEMQSGPMGLYRLLVEWGFGVLEIALIVRVLSSWIRISPYSRWVRWSFTLTEPILRPLRTVIPSVGMIDITPLVAFFVLRLLQWFLLSFA